MVTLQIEQLSDFDDYFAAKRGKVTSTGWVLAQNHIEISWLKDIPLNPYLFFAEPVFDLASFAAFSVAYAP